MSRIKTKALEEEGDCIKQGSEVRRQTAILAAQYHLGPIPPSPPSPRNEILPA